MSFSRLFQSAGEHFYNNRFKYMTLISLATVLTVEAAKMRSIITSEGVAEVLDRPGRDTALPHGISEDCADYAWYRDLCAMVSGYRASMRWDGTAVVEENRVKLVETGTSAVCAAARFFAAQLGEIATAACHGNPDIGIQLKLK